MCFNDKCSKNFLLQPLKQKSRPTSHGKAALLKTFKTIREYKPKMLDLQQTSYETLTDNIFAVPDFSDVQWRRGFDIIEPFEQVPSIQPDDKVYYIDENGHQRYGQFVNSYKRCRRQAYENKFGKSWETAKHWKDEETPYWNEQAENIVRWVCKRSDGVLDFPLAIEVYHPQEIERTYGIKVQIETEILQSL